MTEVTVDLDDLEALVFASSAIKTIEGSLASFRRDPFAQDALGRFVPAQRRLESVMRSARRAERNDTLVKYDEPLTIEESNALQYVVSACDAYVVSACDAKTPGLALFVISPEDKGEPGVAMSVYDRLAAKGCIEVGQFIQGVMWAGADAPQFVADPKGYAARPTTRGRGKLRKAPYVALVQSPHESDVF